MILSILIPVAMALATYAPDFAFTLDGKHYNTSRLRGTVLVLDFAASWCGPCQASLPELSRLNDRYSDVVFLGISQEDAAAVRQLRHALNLSFPIALDSDGSIDRLFGVQAIPTTVIIDRRGRIFDVLIGLQREGVIEDAIRRARREH